MVKGRLSKYILLFLIVSASVIVFNASVSVAQNPRYSHFRERNYEDDYGCEDDEIPILGLEKKDGDGSHAYNPREVKTKYTLCFEEQYYGLMGSWQTEFTDESCEDLDTDDNNVVHALDIDNLNQAEGVLGSHVSLADHSGSSGKLCIWHDGLKVAEEVSGDGEDYLVGTLVKETNSHIGEEDWGNEEVWLNWEPNYDAIEEPEVNITYNTTPAGSKSVTRERDVTFNASVEGELIKEIFIEVESDGGFYENENCTFDYVDDAVCTLTTDNQPFDELENVIFNASVKNILDEEDTDEGEFQVCGFESVEIGNDIGEANCTEGTRIRGEDCQDGQYAGFEVTAIGECPPLFINVSAASSVNVNEDEINKDLLHPEAETDPVLSECKALYGAEGDDRMDGIYQDGGFGSDDVPSGGSLNMEGVWNVGDIPYYCRGEVLEAESFSVYEHENQQDGEIESPEEGILIGGSEASGEITLDPTTKKLEFSVPEKENIRTGLWEYVIPMNVTNWNNRPVVVRMSWESQVNLEESWPVGWDYNFTREFGAGRTSYDSFNPYNYNRRVYVTEGNRDIQLKLGDRGGQKNLEEFALVVRAPYGAHSGPRPGEVSMTRDESILYP